MPQFTYDDIRSKILKRERYKFALNYHQQFYPIFKENSAFFDESKGYKRFLRVTKFYVGIPKTSSPKPPYNSMSTMLPKQVNFIKAQILTVLATDVAADINMVTLNPPHHFMRVSVPTVASDTYKKSGSFDFTGRLQEGSSEVLGAPATLTTLQKANLAYSLSSDGTKIISHNIPTDAGLDGLIKLTPDELARNERPAIDSGLIVSGDGVVKELGGVVYDFFGFSDRISVPRRIVSRSTVNSTARDVTSIDVYNLVFREDKKTDGQLLSEISLFDNRIIINLFENIRTKNLDTSNDTAITQMTTEVTTIGPTVQGLKLQDCDKPLTLDNYFMYDTLTGAFDTTTNSKISGDSSRNNSNNVNTQTIFNKLSRLYRNRNYSS